MKMTTTQMLDSVHKLWKWEKFIAFVESCIKTLTVDDPFYWAHHSKHHLRQPKTHMPCRTHNTHTHTCAIVVDSDYWQQQWTHIAEFTRFVRECECFAIYQTITASKCECIQHVRVYNSSQQTPINEKCITWCKMHIYADTPLNCLFINRNMRIVFMFKSLSLSPSSSPCFQISKWNGFQKPG